MISASASACRSSATPTGLIRATVVVPDRVLGRLSIRADSGDAGACNESGLSGRSWLAVRLSVEEDEIVMKGIFLGPSGTTCALESAVGDSVLARSFVSEPFVAEGSCERSVPTSSCVSLDCSM